MKPNDENGKLQWREKLIAYGFAPEASSPDKQNELGIKIDKTLTQSECEGKKLRED